MLVRPATIHDTDAVLAMAEKFWAASGYDRQGPFDPGHTVALMDLLMSAGILLVAEHDGQVVGMVGLIVSPSLCSPAATMAVEVAWWVEPDQRRTGAALALMRAVEPAARARGCRAIQMHTLANSPPQASAAYRRLGFAPSEFSFTKYLEAA